MIAVLFISIGFFGYVALHSRLLHSGQRLEEKESVRAGTDYFEGVETGRLLLGKKTSLTKEPFQQDTNLESLYAIKTDLESRDNQWLQAIPPEYREHLAETMELGPTVIADPYSYSWQKR